MLIGFRVVVVIVVSIVVMYVIFGVRMLSRDDDVEVLRGNFLPK